MLLLFEGGSDYTSCAATHLEEKNGNCKSAGEVQSTENKRSLQGLLLLQGQDAKPIPQNQFITDLLTFDLYEDLPQIIVGVILIIEMKALEQICYLCPKFTRLTIQLRDCLRMTRLPETQIIKKKISGEKMTVWVNGNF